ncbi:Putative Proline-rich protein RiP-15 [[Torrubiella] hemipterigena]|uniref:Putative Proline-rich protein RiP-15 n=1 Tax=[Torrubiella] hemipterigena TaxID=1531966 RepID=A0A0A1SNP4_9HYPO|nr:Putative Proline-rich protein RiP-15 [[Torrubiella] hemipterigena]
MNAPPPPPPPHGEMPRSSSGLPPGKYDIFVIPEHSAGSGFLYLPSLKPNINSFVAGFASALILVVLFQSITPAFRVWWDSFHGLGNMAMLMLLVGVGFGAWALGRTQNDAGNNNSGSKKREPPNTNGNAGTQPGGQGGFENGHSRGTSNSSAPPPHSPPPPPPPPPNGGGPGPGPSTWDSGSPPNYQYQSQTPPPPKPKPSPQPKSPRPDAKGSWEKARDEMRKKEEERKAKAAEQKRREEISKRLAELRAKEAKERLQREKDKEKKEKEIKEAAEKKAAAAAAAATAKAAASTPSTPAAPPPRAQSSYAYSGVGEKMNMWPNGKPPTPPTHTNTTPKSPASPTKRPPAPTARTYLSTDEDSYSYRPYDKPKQPQRKKSNGSLASDVSWANSHTTARTSPPPSVRGPYTTKDPDKIVIQAVYMFMNQFAKTPASQLISGVGSVTDGLILRITTEGLFIDDDVRGVPQREWDVKGWTLKLVETGEWKTKGLHLLRATVKDQDGKRYLFVIDETEYWKVGASIQRLRRGTQARQLGVAAMTAAEARTTLDTLGWTD